MFGPITSNQSIVYAPLAGPPGAEVGSLTLGKGWNLNREQRTPTYQPRTTTGPQQSQRTLKHPSCLC